MNSSAGKYSAQPESHSCDSCGLGYFSTQDMNTACLRCGQSTYAENASSSRCVPCPEGFTSEAGSSSFADCVCPRGMRRIVAADLGTAAKLGHCQTCEEGLQCHGKWPATWAARGGTPESLPGYMLLSATVAQNAFPQVYKCWNSLQVLEYTSLPWRRTQNMRSKP